MWKRGKSVFSPPSKKHTKQTLQQVCVLKLKKNTAECKNLALDNINTACLLSCCHKSNILVFQATHFGGEKSLVTENKNKKARCVLTWKGAQHSNICEMLQK